MIDLAGRKKKGRVLGIDSSTQGVAWCLVYDGKPQEWGMIDLTKFKGMSTRLKHIYQEFPPLLERLQPDYVYIEQTIYMKSVQTMRILSYIVGALFCLSTGAGYTTEDISPMTAKSHYGYSAISRKFSSKANAVLGSTKGKKFCETLRKSQIQRVNSYNFPEFDSSDHNISDACSIAVYGYCQKIEDIKLNTSQGVRLDLEELKKLGLGGIL